MRIAQIVLDDASAYERKCQRVDFAALAVEHEVGLMTLADAAASGAAVAHLYSSGPLPASKLIGFPLPWVATSELSSRRWAWRKPTAPGVIVSPLFEKEALPPRQSLPEAVEDEWFRWREESGGWQRTERETWTIASFRRASTLNLVQQTLARIGRFREDISWVVFDQPPAPEDLRGVDLWADPAVETEDFDGFVAEAVVAGIPVVASRTPINEIRLEQGRIGTLVRPRDSNEWTHAILSALFKPELSGPKLQSGMQTLSKYRSRTRLRPLVKIYQTLTS